MLEAKKIANSKWLNEKEAIENWNEKDWSLGNTWRLTFGPDEAGHKQTLVLVCHFNEFRTHPDFEKWYVNGNSNYGGIFSDLFPTLEWEGAMFESKEAAMEYAENRILEFIQGLTS